MAMHELSTERSVGTSPKAMLNEDSRALKFILKCGEGNCQELVKVFWGVNVYVAKVCSLYGHSSDMF